VSDDDPAVERYRVRGETFLVVDADGVVDRRDFARRHCRSEPGQGSSAGPAGVLFLSVETDYARPRVVLTLVRPDGSVDAECPGALLVGAAWASERVEDCTCMIDTMNGTRRAEMGDDAVTVEVGVHPDPETAGARTLSAAVGGPTRADGSGGLEARAPADGGVPDVATD
jgi:hypothetical protein